ncbi:MAG: tetratricopeptide repeat protein [Chitinophagales bacterium]
MKAPQFSKLTDFSALGDDELRALAERYPFFAGVHEALALRDRGNWLNKAALRTANRQHLQELLQQENAVTPPVIKTWIADAVADSADEIQPEKHDAETTSLENGTDYHSEEPVVAGTSNEPTATIDTDEKTVFAGENTKVSEVGLQESIEPVASNQEIQDNSAAILSIDTEETESYINTLTQEPTVTLNSTVQDEDSTDVPSDPEPVVLNQPRTFDDWLTVFSAQRPVIAETPENTSQSTADDEINRLITANAAAEFFTESLRQETHYTRDLDRFIEDQKMRAAHKQQAQSGPLITETLAKIYEKQGLTDKAITAYEQLSLKFPEKKAFFALHIEKLKEK